MTTRMNPPVTTMTELLERMGPGGYGSRKGSAVLFRRHKTPIELYIEEYFDSGKGGSNAFGADTTPVEITFFEQAIHERYISGALEPGVVSDWKFVITDFGEEESWKRLATADGLLVQLEEGKGMRACDLMTSPYIFSEEVLQDILDYLVGKKHVEERIQEGQKFYFLPPKHSLD